MQRSGTEGPVGGGEPDLRTVELWFEDHDLSAQADLGVRARSLISSSRSIAAR